MKKIFLVAVLAILVGAVFLTGCTTGEAGCKPVKKIKWNKFKEGKTKNGVPPTVPEIIDDIGTITPESIMTAVRESPDEQITVYLETVLSEDLELLVKVADLAEGVLVERALEP